MILSNMTRLVTIVRVKSSLLLLCEEEWERTKCMYSDPRMLRDPGLNYAKSALPVVFLAL